jgi:folate-dependent phosphoribosylglycinamide formyltransferase PurN
VTLRLAWFATARGTTSAKLLAATQQAIAAGRLDAEIAVVFCNRGPGEDANTDAFLQQARDSGIPLVTLSSRDFRQQAGGEVPHKGEPLPPWRLAYDREVMRLLEPYPFDIGVLAGFMLIFGHEATERWDLLNLHPALPGGPIGMWQDVIWQLIAEEAREAGVMMHLATAQLDGGPVVAYCRYPIRGKGFDPLWHELELHTFEEARAEKGENLRLFRAIRWAGIDREVPLVIETLRAFAEGRIRIKDKRVVDADGKPIPGYDLSQEIEALIARQRTPSTAADR